jgi:hypothetical protein
VGIRCADHATTFIPKKLALTSPTSGCRSVGRVRLWTKATEFSFIIAQINIIFPDFWQRVSPAPLKSGGEATASCSDTTITARLSHLGTLHVYQLLRKYTKLFNSGSKLVTGNYSVLRNFLTIVWWLLNPAAFLVGVKLGAGAPRGVGNPCQSR